MMGEYPMGGIVPLVKWTKEYSVSVKVLDDQHRGLVRILNDLHAAALKGEMPGVASQQLSKMIRLSSEHFDTEEGLMESTGYPGLAEHRAKHEALSGRISEFMARHQEHDRTSYVQLLYFALNWFQDHMRQEDGKYVPWMNAHGLH